MQMLDRRKSRWFGGKSSCHRATAHRTLDLVDGAGYISYGQGNAVYESQYLLGTSIARPIIAKAQIDIAREFNAHAVLMVRLEKEMSADLN